MIGMDFTGFIILLIISVIVTAIIHFGFKYYVIPGWGSFLSKVIVGWIGAWLGSPVFGYWFKGLAYQDIYIIPAILGAIAANILVVDVCKTLKG
jgi:uncharacterized membrane protein YeaQ/YmgE (transglycosylase-associated protein family)